MCACALLPRGQGRQLNLGFMPLLGKEAILKAGTDAATWANAWPREVGCGGGATQRQREASTTGPYGVPAPARGKVVKTLGAGVNSMLSFAKKDIVAVTYGGEMHQSLQEELVQTLDQLELTAH